MESIQQLWTRSSTLRDIIKYEHVDIFNFSYNVDMDKYLFEQRIIKHYLYDEIGYPLPEFLSRFESVVLDNLDRFNDILRVNNIEYDILNRDLVNINTDSTSDTDSSSKEQYEENGRSVDKVMPFTAIQSNSNYVTNQNETESETSDNTTSKTKNSQETHKKGYTFPTKIYQEMIAKEKEKFVNPFEFLYKELDNLFTAIY